MAIARTFCGPPCQMKYYNSYGYKAALPDERRRADLLDRARAGDDQAVWLLQRIYRLKTWIVDGKKIF